MKNSYKIKVLSVSQEIQTLPNETVLDAVLREGFNYPFSCKAGKCSACKSRLLSGEVDHLTHNRFTLTEEEKAQGLFLACRAIPKTNVEISPLDETKAAVVPARLSMQVAQKEQLSHDTVRLVLKSTDGTTLDFQPGQFAMLKIDGFPQRSYSMTNQPGTNELHFYIRQIPKGLVSDEAVSKIRTGDLVQVDGPYGNSYLETSHTGPILLVAGGSGIGPVRSILDRALAIGMKQPIYLYFGVREMRDVYLREHFRDLEAKHQNFHFQMAVDRGSDEANFYSGRVGDLVTKDWTHFEGEWRAYLAGPPPMVDGISQTLIAKSFDPTWIKSDPFYSSSESSKISNF